MKDKLTFITASAGTGKTFQLVEQIRDAIVNHGTRPEAIVATTFTRDAANEMRQRLSSAFHKEGLHDEAARLENDALISTVHGICFQLLNRFAFEAGISPDLRVLDEAETRLLLDRSVDEVVDEKTRQQIYNLASRLGQRNTRTWQWTWRFDVKKIVEETRSNDIALDALPEMAKASWEEMKSELGPATAQDLNQLLLDRFPAFYEESGASTKKNTNTYRELLDAFSSRVHSENFPWSNWEKLTTLKPEVALHDFSDDIADVARRVQEHPRLHRDLEEYISLLFEVAKNAGTRFAQLKKERGAADYADLEKATLDLLRGNPSIKAILGEDIELLLVDEFQDTSPIQLALFAELGQLANQVIWVGDVKQSIYGFRGSDPELVFQAASGATKGTPLRTSWRSLPDLVELSNRVFGPAFADQLGLPEEETIIKAHREAMSDVATVEVARILSGEMIRRDGSPKKLTWAKKQSTIADAVSDLIRRPGECVGEKNSISKLEARGTTRELLAGDVAVLVRRRANAEAIAGQLRNRGFDVSMVGSGLLATPEAVLALACLKRWIDPGDSLAAAEVVALEGLNSVEDWLEDRLRYAVEVESSEAMQPWLPELSPALRALQDSLESDALHTLSSPLICFDKALKAASVNRIVSQWGPGETRAEQRLANLEQLRCLIEDYENRSLSFGTPATLNGLFGWLDGLADTGEDTFPETRSEGAISVGTYHSSKGLEWPVVFLADLSDSPRSGLYNLRVTREAGESIDFSEPLKGRELRLWIHPFGKGLSRGSEHPVDGSLEESKTGRSVARSDDCELLRLLYVGMTRARDRMIFIDEPGTDMIWLESLGTERVREILDGSLAGIPIVQRSYTYSPESEQGKSDSKSILNLPRCVSGKTKRLPASVKPSSAGEVEGATVIENLRYGNRLTWNETLKSERDLGDAMHRIFAAEVLQADHSVAERKARIAGILGVYELDKQFDLQGVVESLDQYRFFVRDKFAPEKEEVEVPFSVTNSHGQKVTGYIDHLLHLSDGKKVILDHKIFPGSKEFQEEKALSYSGQLATYAAGLGEVGKVETWIHFATTGVAIRLKI